MFKRSRTTYESDRTAPFVLYGTALPPLDPEVRDDGSFVPVWKQEVRDEKGRKRLHGAFTGGFSAGYFNTVGSKEGWTPSTFVSSRSSRTKDAAQSRPEDFMDDEDRAEAEESRKLSTNDAFAGLGSRAEHQQPSNDVLLDLFRPSGDTMGTTLMRKMGWRDGQGIGPRVRRGSDPSHLFAPKDSPMIALHRKNDRKGLGFGQEARLVSKPAPVPKSQGSIGVGVLNDTGSDDDDPYSMGPRISYHRVIGGENKKKPKVSAANPRLGKAPVFVSKKADALRRCRDGRLPIAGFVLLDDVLEIQQNHAPPQVPDGWISTRKSTVAPQIAEKSQLSPRSRAKLLGEEALPGKSVFDFMKPDARSKIAHVTKNAHLPPAMGEVPTEYNQTTKTLHDLVPYLEPELARTALERGRSGWMPYGEDPAKRERYRSFLQISATQQDKLPERVPGANNDDWTRELHEFAHAARIFKPMTGFMASRFTSSTAPTAASEDKDGDESLISKPAEKQRSAAEEAAAMGMYGALTRTETQFFPTRLLCKRFGVVPPAHVTEEVAETPKSLDLVQNVQAMAPQGAVPEVDSPAKKVTVDPERNDALEVDRPAEDLFKAVFGSDSE